MKLIFGASYMPGSLFLQGCTFSRWSHVGVVYGQEVIEARWPRVRKTTLGEFLAHYPRIDFGWLDCADEAAAEAWIRSRIGHLYDLAGLIAFPFQRDWQSNSRDFCSEMPLLGCRQGGTIHVRNDSIHRVTPGVLHMISKPIAH